MTVLITPTEQSAVKLFTPYERYFVLIFQALVYFGKQTWTNCSLSLNIWIFFFFSKISTPLIFFTTQSQFPINPTLSDHHFWSAESFPNSPKRIGEGSLRTIHRVNYWFFFFREIKTKHLSEKCEIDWELKKVFYFRVFTKLKLVSKKQWWCKLRNLTI